MATAHPKLTAGGRAAAIAALKLHLGAGYRNRHRPLFELMVPVAAAVVWLAVVQGGSTLFGWTA